MDHEMEALAAATGQWLLARGWWLATAESCTGGGIAEAITSVSGSSAYFDCAIVTYSNAAKIRLLGVPPEALEDDGAVSETVVAHMTRGALAHSDAQVAVAVSGVAGPSGGTSAKPVGTVCFSWRWPGHPTVCETLVFKGNRASIRRQAVIHALRGIQHENR